MKAISIRQPWAWLIVNGYKDIENRSWRTKYRGPVLIHAAQGMTRRDYDAAVSYAAEINPLLPFSIPKFEDIERGGIVGVATITSCVDWHQSWWYMGEKGFVLTDAKPLPFYPMKGRLSFFEAVTPFDIGCQAAYAGLSYAENPFVTGDNVTLPHSDDWQQGFLTVRDSR